MSLDTVRDAISRAKKNEAATCSQSRRRKLRDLYAATTFTIKAPKSLHDFNFAAIPDPTELAFLDENDIEKGRYFSDATLPLPSLELYPLNKNQESTTTTQPSSTSHPPTDASAPVVGDSAPKETSHTPLASALKAPTPSIEATKQKTPRAGRHVKSQVTVEIEQPATAEIPGAAENGAREGSVNPANNAEQNVVAKRDGKAEDRSGPTNTLPSGEAVSSPSSTVGPYSTNTPHLNHPSPDTSPDEDSFPDGVHSIRKGESASEKNGDSALDASPSKKSTSQVQPSSATPDAQLRAEERLSSKLRQSSQHLSSSSQGQPPVSPIATPAGDDADTAQKTGDARQARQTEPAKDPNAMDLDEPQMSSDDTTKLNGPRGEKADAQESINDSPLQTQQSQENQPTNAVPDSGDLQMDDADQIPLSASTINEASASQGLNGTSADGLQSKRPANLQLDDDQAVESPEPLTTGKSIPDSARTPGDRPRSSGKHRRRRSTVIFPKQTGESRLDSMQRTCLDYAALKGASQDEKKDYLQSLFECQAYTLPRAQPLDHLITTANKTLTTGNHAANILEQHDARILKRVYGLQNANRWSCRQMERSVEPPRPETVHDVLLRHVKNMRTDFREERKWKVAVARNLANACAAWVSSSAEGRQAMQVRIKRKHRRDVSNSESGMQSPAHSTPELIPSNGSETEQELLRDDDVALADPNETQPPAALFSLGIDDVIFKMEPTPIAESLLMELPHYDATKQNLSSELSQSIVPVSKFIGSKLASKHTGPPRKKRRYDYESEEDLPNYPSKRHALDHTISLSPSRRSTSLDLPAEQTNVALFNPENKHLRERLHASHAFRPPMEFPMPSTSFFESRQSSQWTWDEDQKLRGYVKDYSFNWSLISSHLHVSSLFNSGAERRTPWECFERWVQLEGLPAEMSKTPYFRTYQSRLEAAQRTIAAQQLQQQQVQTPGSALGPPRRRTMQPMRVERRRNNRYLALVDAMRKLARKKEQLAHKHQEAAKAAALRKAHEAAHPKTSVHTPQEFSRLRQERDVKVREKQEMLQQQMNAQNRQNAMMQRSGQMLGPNAAAAAAQQRNGPPRNSNGGNPSAGAQQGVQQANMGMQGRAQSQQAGVPNSYPNGLMPNMQMNNQNMGQMSMQQRMQILQQQRNFAGQNQAQGQFQNQQHLANMSANGQQMQNQAAMMAAMGVKVNGAMSPSANGMASSAASPRLQQQNHQGQNHQPQPLSSGHVPAVAQISHQIQTQNPQLSPDQVRQLTADRLKNHMYQQQRQNALNSAAGTPTTSTPNGYNQANFQQTGMNGSPNPSYHQQLRQQMMQQQQAANQGSPQMNGANPSRSGTPQNAQGQAQGNGQHQRAGSGSLNGGSPGIQSR